MREFEKLMRMAREAESKMSEGLFDAAEEMLAQELSLCASFLENPALPRAVVQTVKSLHNRAVNHLSAVLYFSYADSPRIVDLLKQSVCTDSATLSILGISLFRTCAVPAAHAALLKAYQLRETVLNAEDWQQTAFTDGMLRLSALLRDGLAPDHRPNPEMALEVLRNTLKVITDQDMVYVLLHELNCRGRIARPDLRVIG